MPCCLVAGTTVASSADADTIAAFTTGSFVGEDLLLSGLDRLLPVSRKQPPSAVASCWSPHGRARTALFCFLATALAAK